MLVRWAGLDPNDPYAVGGDLINNASIAFLGRPLLDGLTWLNSNLMETFQLFSAEEGTRFYLQVATSQVTSSTLEFLRALLDATPASEDGFTVSEIEAIAAPIAANMSPNPFVTPELVQLASKIRYNVSNDSLEGDLLGYFKDLLDSGGISVGDDWDDVKSWMGSNALLIGTLDPTHAVVNDAIRAQTENTLLEITRDLVPAYLGGPLIQPDNTPFASITGTSGNDTLSGDQGSVTATDLIQGGAGNDTLAGGAGSDTYVFEDGCGSDTVYDSSGANDELAFQGSLTSSLARFGFANSGHQDLLIEFSGRSEQVTVTGFFSNDGVASIERVTFADGVLASSRSIRDAVMATLATSGNDTITAFAAGSAVIGDAGNDTLSGSDGDDYIVGGEGDDTLNESAGKDVYYWQVGDGDDTITNFGAFDGTNTLILGGDIIPQEVELRMSSSGADLIISISGESGSIKLVNQITTYANYGLDYIQFTNGAVWDRARYTSELYKQSATDSADTLWMTNFGGELFAKDGDDTINVRGYDAIVHGDEGDDTINVTTSASNTTIVWNLGDGEDVVFIGSGGDGDANTVKFGPGIAPTDLRFAQTSDGNGLIVSVDGEPGSITLRYQLSTYADYGIDRFLFDDGTVWNRATYSNNAYASIAGSGNDTIWMAGAGGTVNALGGNDTIYARGNGSIISGGTGNDTIDTASNWASNSTINWNLGDGDDIVIAGSGGDGTANTLHFGAGIDPTDLKFAATEDGNGLIVTVDGEPGSVTLRYQLSTYSDYGIDRFTFDDSTVWDRATYMAAAYASMATSGNDTIWLASAGGTIDALGGNDTIYARGNGSVLSGGTGNDTINTSSGWASNSTIIWNLGDGDDTVFAGSGGDGESNTLKFGAGIAPGDLKFATADDGNSLVVSVDSEPGSITLKYQLSTYSDYGIDRFQFDDTTIWNRATYTAAAYVSMATSGNDNIAMASIGGTVDALGGNDTILVRGINSVVSGGTGDDTINTSSAYAYNATVIWNLGDGNDIIIAGSGGDGDYNTLKFGAGIAPADLRFAETSDGQGLIVSVDGEPGSVTLRYQLTTYGDYGIDRFVFDDTTVWDRATYMAAAYADLPTSGNDTIWLANINSTIDALAGDDTIHGGYANDRITGGAGDDMIYGSWGSDTLVLAGDQSDYSIATVGGAVTITDNAPTVDGNDGTDTISGIETVEFKGAVQVGVSSPIVLDMDGDGVHLVHNRETNVAFDWNKDGLADQTGWISAGDAFLAIDRDGDGTVSGANELSFVDDKAAAKSDLDGLSAFDSNGDGVLSADDQRFSSFLVWQDANSNGIADAGETHTLAEAGVSSIGLSGSAVNRSWGWDDSITVNTGAFTRTDGSIGALSDVAFTYTAATAAQQMVQAMNSFGVQSAGDVSAFKVEAAERMPHWQMSSGRERSMDRPYDIA